MYKLSKISILFDVHHSIVNFV